PGTAQYACVKPGIFKAISVLLMRRFFTEYARTRGFAGVEKNNRKEKEEFESLREKIWHK
ncbi:MAG: hypothetical protein H7122_06870, partial [Chitinophagaceae bacterium]|nr:hypothetical protein [Chitinophagaceae bacterium]